MTGSPGLRFSTGAALVTSGERLRRAARRAEDLGYATFVVPDHFMIPLAPLIALQAVADATTTIRVGQLTLAQGFRHPAVLAKELATLDVLSDGRLEIGIGAGWMAEEFAQAGIGFPTAGRRIGQLEEAVAVMKGLFGEEPLFFSGEHFTIDGLEGTPKPIQKPHPPIMVGGRGPKLLAAAARHADIVQILPGAPGGGESTTVASLSGDSFAEKIDWIREAADDRFGSVELSVLLMNVTITDDPEAALDALASRLGLADPRTGDRDTLRQSPVVAIGSVGEVCEKLLQVAETFGIGYFGAPHDTRPEVLEPVLESLSST